MIFHDVEQNSEAWMQLRIGKATGSNFGCFMANDGKAFGDPAKKYALQLALERINGKKAEFSFSNDHMERGHEQEPVAKMLYEESRFVNVSNGGFFDCGEYGDSPDGIVLGARERGAIEIKSVIAATHYATLIRGSCDPSYKWQLVGHIDCAKVDWVDFVSYCSDFPEEKQLIVYRTYRDEVAEELARLKERREEFIELVKTTLERIKNG
jgi:hypothetical protein